MSSEYILDRLRRIPKSWIFLCLIVLFVVFVRVRLLDIPLERDEGEYAYMGQLLLQGIPPYGEAYNMKFPGTYLMYALIMALFGQTTQGIHIGLIVVNCSAILLVYLLARKMIDDLPAAVAAGTCGVLSLSSSVFGFAAHATHFVVLPALGGTLLLLSALEKENFRLYFLSGTLLGISTMMKQPGIFFVLFAITYLLFDHVSAGPHRSLKKLASRLVMLCTGALLPFFITALWLYVAGVFPKFWFWAFAYASRYGSRVPEGLFGGLRGSFPLVVDGFVVFWILSGLGLITIFFNRGLKVNKAFVVLFAFFSFLSISTGFYYREQYYLTLLPAVALLAGIFMDFLFSGSITFLKSRYSPIIVIGIFVVALAIGVIRQKGYFLEDDPVRISQSLYSGNPFQESVEIAGFVKQRTGPDDRIAVLGSEPEIFFYANRRSATGYIYMYGLMESHEYALRMQQEMIAEIEASRPKFLIDVRSGLSWLQHDDSEPYIFRWLDGYVAAYYDLVGVADMLYPGLTVYKWYDEAKNYRIRSDSSLVIYERR